MSSDVWRTGISEVTDHKVFIRGHDLESLIASADFTQSTFLLIRGRMPTDNEARVFNAALNGVLDLSLEKPGTVAARFAVSGNPNVAAGMATACLSVGKYTLATEDTARFVAKLHQEFLATTKVRGQFVTDKVAQLIDSGSRIPGLGHPFFKTIDPRAAKLREIAVREGVWGQAAQLYEEIHEEFKRVTGKAQIPMNDVGVIATILASLGFTPEEGTGLAILSTLPGIIAHISEELREGKPIRTWPRDRTEYTGPTQDVFTS